jgi:osmoprotectant transport system substrate-binding protein/osmoprotectant transport system permease protein
MGSEPSRLGQPGRRLTAALAIAFCLLAVPTARAADSLHLIVGAKKFTEGAILAELMAQVVEAQTGARVERRFNLAGTQVCFDALRDGEIDFYAEYTGTGLRDILDDDSPVSGPADAYARVSSAFLERFGLRWLAPFGFDNTYVLVMPKSVAAAQHIRTISDLARHALRYGVSHEFLQRPDGMPGLRRVYGLREASTVGLEHDLAYQALSEGAIDVSDGYSTDAKILRYHLAVLRDDRHFFPPYEAAPLVRADLSARAPAAAAALALLAGRIDAETMRRLNFQVEEGRRPASEVAHEFLESLGIGGASHSHSARRGSLLELLWQRRGITAELALQHLFLTGTAVLAACLIGIPAGIAASRRPTLAAALLGSAGVLQTIPSIALLAFMLPLFGIGARPAIAALFLYGLLPILRNTVTGLRAVSPQLIEVGRGLGMKPRQVLWQVELPIAAPVLLAGVRTATVISVGTATLAAFIGAGGLGDPIVTGLSVTDTQLVLSGALPAAALAIALDVLLAGAERLATPYGLRLRAARD